MCRVDVGLGGVHDDQEKRMLKLDGRIDRGTEEDMDSI